MITSTNEVNFKLKDKTCENFLYIFYRKMEAGWSVFNSSRKKKSLGKLTWLP